MPWATREKHRAYQRKYNATDKAKKRRAENNKARRMMEKKGLVKKGDGKDVHHKTPLIKGGKSNMSNLAVTSRKKNRGYARGKPGQVKTRG